jgi:tetratricopeptide (TPR) repeat protein
MNRILPFAFLILSPVFCFAQTDALLQEAFHKLNSRNYEGAIQDFNKVISINSQNTEALCGRAETKLALNKNDEVLTDINIVLGIDANHQKALILKGEYYFSQKDYNMAIKFYDMAMAQPGTPNQAITGKAKSFYNLGKSKEAFSLLDESISKYPSSADLYFSRGLLYNLTQKYSKALTDFDKAVMLNPDFNTFGVYFNRGLAYFNVQEYASAIADFEKAKDADPMNATAYSQLALSYYQSESYPEAVSNYLKASELSPNNPNVIYNLGMAYYKLDDIENACIYFQKACQMKNTNACKMVVLTCQGK